LGLTLAENVNSATDLPQFDKSIVDGYAVVSTDLQSGSATLRVIDLVTAGNVSTSRVESGSAIQIMTGAPLPDGSDAVIKVEETNRVGLDVTIETTPPRAGTNIIRKGTSVRAGACVLSAGLMLNGPRIGALAELGIASVPIRWRPRVAILATGDELVEVQQQPGPGQIRNSNELMLAAQIESAGGIAVRLGIVRDNREDLRAKIAKGLESDLLVLSGGVSAGTLDLVPSALAEAGVQQIFHKAEMKPGKPIWFGVRNKVPDAAHRTCYVFGLPGNPVSSLVCCELFVRTALRRLMGVNPATPQSSSARLQHDYTNRNDRPTYHPARLSPTEHGLAVTLVPWHGSSDLCGTVAANGMAFLSPETKEFRMGDPVPVFAW
jgi:molybdopterin molybdotransferase